MRPIRTLAAGAIYVLAYVCLTLVVPSPPAARRPLYALPLMAVPAAAALLLAARAARASHGAERTFWKLFVLATSAHLVSQGAFFLQALRETSRALSMVAGHLGYYGFAVLSMVALIVRPHRPRTSRVATTAAVEWIMALAGFYFLFYYFWLVPVGGLQRSGHAIFSLQEALPAAAAVFLALTTREAPFRNAYRALALGFGGAMALNVLETWAGPRGGAWIFTPRDAVWMLPFVGIAAAATGPRGPFWAGITPTPGRSRGWLAASAIMLPPAVDLFTRVLGWQPQLAAARSQTTLVAVILMSLLLAWRLREAPADALTPGELVDGPAARAARTAHLAFASGVSHELNNPLMAVAGWAEVVQSRGEAHPSVGRVLEAARAAADAVGRLQKVVAAGVADPVRPTGDE